MLASAGGRREASVLLTSRCALSRVALLALLVLAFTAGLQQAAATHPVSCAPTVTLADPHGARAWSNDDSPRWSWSSPSECTIVDSGVRLDGGAESIVNGASFEPTLADGEHSVVVRVRVEHRYLSCNWWNGCTWYTTSAWSASAAGPIARIDTVPPIVWESVLNPHRVVGSALFVSSATPFEAAARDAVSGIARFERSLDRSAWEPYTGAFQIAGVDGNHEISLRAEDGAGNVASKRLPVALDNAPPQIVVTRPTGTSATADGVTLGTCAPGTVIGPEGPVFYPPPSPPSPGIPFVELPASRSLLRARARRRAPSA